MTHRAKRLATGAAKPRAAAVQSPLLTPVQIGSLGVLLVAAQLPQAVHLPIWVALFGVALVVLRFVLLRRDRARPSATPARIPSWALAVFALAIAFAIRKSYGYFVGRDPCVAFLFVLVGIKFLEVRTLRDGTLLVCLAIFLLITPFFYSQSLLAALAALPPCSPLAQPWNRLRTTIRRRHRRRGAPRGAAPPQCSRRDCRSPLRCSCCFRGLRARCGACPPIAPRRPDCPNGWHPVRSASSR